ncbi:hypothetical protein [Antrihabitans cavernicola]|uniref:Uncharacterized protein n=1 Tax=Antrihabitans cavernicola TaxID=2495913 RepID=A0A5A7S4G4_9NOCA|nr:hypothetical protein [Spelaeibacter cavernicola]KAA0017013.1 hypothetical protein FOY51_25570 [Spelaeibacter cavernicola]
MGTARLAAAFVRSAYRTGRYAHWTLDRQLVAFLANGRDTAWVLTDDATFNNLYRVVQAGQRRLSANG